MNPRELLILLLGLAIVAVVLRGLYVAIQARRGQIRLAIDKNIPKDVDLDALEMAELPSGGARVVNRGNPGQARIDQAEARARAMDLSDDEDVPVLMDAVQIRAPAAEQAVDDEDDYLDDAEADAFEEEEEGSYSGEAAGDDVRYETEDDVSDEDPDAVLMDYGEDDLSSVAPDYEPEEEGDYEDDVDGGDDARAEDLEEDDYPDQEYDDGYDNDNDEYENDDEYDDEYDADEVYGELDDEDVNSDARQDPELGSRNLDDDGLDDFSMTAGERIGYEGQKPRAPARQSSLFDDDAAPEPETVAPKAGKRKSLFAAFSRKKSTATAEPKSKPEKAPAEPVRAEPQPQSVQQAAAETTHQSTPEQVPEAASVQPLRAAEPEPAAEYHSEPSEVLVISVMAKPGRSFRGDDILHTLITAGLKFGDMNIFHARLGRDANSPVLFSVANILNPGTFDLNTMDSFTTVGISFFLALPSPINNLDAFDKMMTTAEQIRQSLDGELKDDNRNGMTAQTREHYRQRVRDFELRKLKAAGGRG